MAKTRAVRALLCVGALLLASTSARAQTPGEVQDVAFDATGDLSWTTEPAADFYNVYRSVIGAGFGSLRCFGDRVPATSLTGLADPQPGQIFAYVVTGESAAGGEGTPGADSGATSRYLQGACTPLVTHMLLNRSSFGWNEWSRDRIALLGGMSAYIDEQLDPLTIDESTNMLLYNKLLPYDPPLDFFDLIGRDVVYAVHARRQVEQKLAMFWTNHFNTDWKKVSVYFEELFPSCADQPSHPACTLNFPERANKEAAATQLTDFTAFRNLAFYGNFRQMLEAGTVSPAMLLYLDLHLSVAVDPNENQPRELLELHSMGVDAGYTQTDVEELSRVMTGWGVCKKADVDLGDPLAPCIASYWLLTGDWTANFDITRHDCGAKTLFAGEPEEISLPGTPGCSSASDAAAAIAELDLALDAIAAHPSTPRFIATKLLQYLVTETPDPSMVDAVVAVWNNPGNLHGVGDLRAVTRAALDQLRPEHAAGKIKTPFEQFVTSLRPLRGNTDGLSVISSSLTDAQHMRYNYEIPTGFSEMGQDWLDTSGTMIRQNWGIRVGTYPLSPSFSVQPVALLNAHGISTAPGNADAIIDFLVEILFGGNLTEAEVARAVKYLNTDDVRQPDPYDDDRIRETVALLLGYAEFQEQ